MPNKLIWYSVGIGLVWLAITVFNLFGWIREGFYGGLGIIAYYFFGLLVPLVSAVGALIIFPTDRLKSAAKAFLITLATLLIGFSLLYLSSRAEEQRWIREDAEDQLRYQRELEQAKQFRSQNN